MRIEFTQKILDLSDEERDRFEKMNIEPKEKHFKYRKMWVQVEDITGVYEVSDKETILEFADGQKLTVKGSYDTIKGLIESHEEEKEKDLNLWKLLVLVYAPGYS